MNLCESPTCSEGQQWKGKLGEKADMKQWVTDNDMCATESSRSVYRHLSSRNELTFHHDDLIN